MMKKLPNRIRFFNKRVTNRLTMTFAGASHSPISIVGHVGRRSRKTYETPVVVEPVPDGFVFALTYGPDVDWYRNVLAAGHCTLVWHGQKYALEKPAPIDAKAALPAFPLVFRSMLRLIGTQHFLRMKRS
jgi:deazaflavin-dependent oxidoreductase (nitroreductase family)